MWFRGKQKYVSVEVGTLLSKPTHNFIVKNWTAVFMLDINKIKIISIATRQTLVREKKKRKKEKEKQKADKEPSLEKKIPNNRRTFPHYNKA